MALLTDQFNDFHATIALDNSRRNRIVAAHNALRDFAEADGPLRAVLQESFLQGSIRHGTAIWPLRGEFDVDVVLVLDARDPRSIFGLSRSPSDIVKWVASRLRTCHRYAGKVLQGRRCVRVEFAGEFHMDVVPARRQELFGEGLEIPDRAAGSWISTHPKGLMSWCKEQNRRTANRFTRVVKMLKWWRDERFGDVSAPRSIVIEALVGKYMPDEPRSDAEAVVTTLESMRTGLGVFVPYLRNPTNWLEDFARDWRLRDYGVFRRRVATAAETAHRALADSDLERSARRWRELFGDTFPA